MNGWLIAGWFLFLGVAAAVWHNFSWSRMQRRVAQQRPNLDRKTYEEVLLDSAVSGTVANVLYDALIPLCVKGVNPHPDDGLCGFYFDDPEDMEDLIEEIFEKLGIPKPTRYAPEITPYLESSRDLAVHLQSKLDE